MKLVKSLLFVLMASLLFSCAHDDGKINLTLLQLNDVYEIAPIQGGEYGGLARVETLHKQLLHENKNTFFVLAGDFLNPSLLGTLTYKGERIRGKQMVEVLNAMHTDLVAFGNHEFDLSAPDLQKRIDESTFDWVAGNARHRIGNDTIPFVKIENNQTKPIPDTYIKSFTDADGTEVKVGFISVCVPSNPKDYVTYSDMFQAAQKSYAALKDKVDFVVGLTHVSIFQDKKIARLLPNIPLIMGGHEHTNMYVSVGNTKIAKADANAKTAYVHHILYDKKTGKLQLHSKLKTIDTSVATDTAVNIIVTKWQAILQGKIKEIIAEPNQVIYTSNVPLDARDKSIRSIQTNLGQLLTEAMSAAFDNKVDCALVNGGSIRIDDELQGDITPIDIFRVLPFGGAILKVKLKGSLLIKVLDFGEKAAGTGAYLQRYQADFVNGHWQVHHRDIQPTKTYTVAFSDYLLKGFDIPFLSDKNPEVLHIYKPKIGEIATDIRKVLINYLSRK